MDYLRKVADHLPEPWKGCCLHVLNHPSFAAWPAATSNHHAYPGGLAVHTAEVLEFTSHTVEMNPALNKIVLTVAAIYHDFGKIWDYQPNPNYPTAPESKPWTITDHFQLVHHIQRSYQEFVDKAKGTDPNMQMLIGHCILAHHGCPAWGSPVEPKTQEAWALHLADMFSARCMNARPPEKTS
jgi:3'-5' exoribonuclease